MKRAIVQIVIEDDEDREDTIRSCLAFVDKHITRGTYSVQLDETPFDGEFAKTPYKSIKDFNVALRKLATRTVNAFDALGVGQRNVLYEAWSKIADQENITDNLDETIKEKVARLEGLQEAINTTLSAIGSLEDNKRELDRACDGIEAALKY